MPRPHERQPVHRPPVEDRDQDRDQEQSQDQDREMPRKARFAHGDDTDLIPPLQPLDRELVALQEIDHFFRKHYPEIRDAANELPLACESINEGIYRAICNYQKDKIRLAKFEAQVYAKLRQEWNSRFSDKMTEKALDQAVALDDELNAEKERVAFLKGSITRLTNCMENLRIKLEAMRSVESTRRKLVDDPD